MFLYTIADPYVRLSSLATKYTSHEMAIVNGIFVFTIHCFHDVKTLLCVYAL